MKALAIAALMVSLPSAAAAQSDLPGAITDGMYMTLAEIRSNSMDAFEVLAGPEGGPIARSQFVSTKVPPGTLESKSERQLLDRLFGVLDANSNGEVSLSEWRSGLEKDLQFADQNDDGRVTLKELANAKPNMSFGDALGMVF